MKKFYSKFIDFSAKYTFFTAALLLLVLVFELLYLKHNLKIDTDLRALFEGSNPTVIELEKMEEVVGGYSTVLVVAKSPNRENNIEALRQIRDRIKDDPLVRSVEFDRDIGYLEQNALLFATTDELERIKSEIQGQIRKRVEAELALDGSPDEAKTADDDGGDLVAKMDEVLKRAEEYRERYKMSKFYEAEQGTFVAMKVRPTGGETNINDTKKIVDMLESAIAVVKPEKLGVEVDAGGLYRNKLSEMNAIYNDVFSTLAICIVLLSLTIIFYFRSVRALFVVFLPLSVGVLTAISAMQFFIGGFNIISAFSFTILYGLGIDFSIHLLGRYSEERLKNDNCVEALKSSSTKNLPAIFSGAITTVAAFFSLILIDFKGFSDFGLAAAVGVSTSFLAIAVFFPTVVLFFDRFSPLKVNVRTTDFLAKVYSAFSKRSGTVVAIFAVLTVVALASVSFATIEYNFDNLSFPGKYDDKNITNQYIEAIKKEKTDSISTGLPSFIVTASAAETEDATRALAKIAAEKKSTIELKDFISIYSFLPEKQDEKLKTIATIKRLIERKINLFDEKTVAKYNDEFKKYLEVTEPMEKEKLPDWITDKLSLKDGSSDRFIMLAIGGNKSDINDVIKIRNDYGVIHGEKGDYKVLGSYMLLSEIKNVIDRHVPLAVLFAFTTVFLVLILLYRSFKSSLIVFFPLIAGIFWMVLTAVVCGIKFNVFNMIVIPTVIGTGIDSAIHIFHRYSSSPDSMEENLKNTGGSVFYSSLTTFVGFASVAIAQHKGLQSIGIMASIGIVTVTLVNLVFFPILIDFVAKRKK
ncbi:MMPL family transporter [bacterium]|nr:MMPL family transporter [bacterium]